jgi:hypothetical protein
MTARDWLKETEPTRTGHLFARLSAFVLGFALAVQLYAHDARVFGTVPVVWAALAVVAVLLALSAANRQERGIRHGDFSHRLWAEP